MTVIADQATRREIAERVQQALDRHQPRRYRVHVNPDAIMQQDDWFHVVVESENDARDRDFYDALERAESELVDDQGHHYLLVPALGD